MSDAVCTDYAAVTEVRAADTAARMLPAEATAC